MKRRIKINGMVAFCAFLSVVTFPNIFFRQGKATFFSAVLELFGITFILLGQILRASSRGFKSENSQDGRSLIQSGPYALVRNPMYLGILLIGAGFVIALFKWWVVFIFLAVFISRYLILLFKEEKRLKALFPKDYLDYRKRAPRLLPSIKMLSKTDVAVYLPLKLSWLKREAGSILAVVLNVLFFDFWLALKTEGICAYTKDVTLIFAVIILFIPLVIYLIRRTTYCKRDVSGKS